MDLTFQVPMQYCSYSIGLDFYHHSHPQLVVVFLWLYPFILSEVISPLISSSILATYQPGEFIFQCPIFLPFHTFHGVLKSRILKWCALPFSSGPHSVRPLHRDRSVSGGTSPQSKNKTYNCIKVSMWRLVADLFITLNWKLLNASLKKKIHWTIADLLCCVNFRYIAKSIGYPYSSIQSFFFF